MYRNGSYASYPKKILGSVVIYAMTKLGVSATIWNAVVEGLSQWIMWRNIERQCIIIHVGRYALDIPLTPADSIDMIEQDSHSYIELSPFTPASGPWRWSINAHTTHTAAVTNLCRNTKTTSRSLPIHVSSWSAIRRLADRMPSHWKGHATYSDMWMLLMQTQL